MHSLSAALGGINGMLGLGVVVTILFFWFYVNIQLPKIILNERESAKRELLQDYQNKMMRIFLLRGWRGLMFIGILIAMWLASRFI